MVLSSLFTAGAHAGECGKAGWYVEEANKVLLSEPEKAESLYREALKYCPSSTVLMYNLGLSLYARGDNSGAVDALSEALMADPSHRDAMRMLAYVYVKEGIDPMRGKMLAETVLEEAPDDRGAKDIIMLAITGAAPLAAVKGTEERRAEKASPPPLRPPPSAVTRVPDVDVDVPVGNAKNPSAIAVVIGNRDYESGDIPSVDFAVRDAESVRKYLVSALGYSEGNVIYETNATKAKFESVFGIMGNHRGRLYNYLMKGKSDIFIYYSGHGAPDAESRQGYIVPVDADPQAISLTGYPLKQLYDNIAKTAEEMRVPNVFIVLDSCFSGATEKGLLLKNVSPISIEVRNPLLVLPNAVVLTSASGAEVSSWYPEKRHSMFTYFFLKALMEEMVRGGGPVTAGRIFSLITDETEGLPYYARRLHGRIQTPQLVGDGNRVMVKEGN
jgi:tetratricopeptide (TPR) repeat protein